MCMICYSAMQSRSLWRAEPAWSGTEDFWGDDLAASVMTEGWIEHAEVLAGSVGEAGDTADWVELYSEQPGEALVLVRNLSGDASLSATGRDGSGDQIGATETVDTTSQHRVLLNGTDASTYIEISGSGNYDVTMLLGDHAEGGAAVITRGESFVGALDSPTDVDDITLNVTAGEEIIVKLRGYYTEPTDPYLEILRPDGSVIAANNDSGDGQDAQISFTPETSGEVILRVSTRADDAIPFAYELDASAPVVPATAEEAANYLIEGYAAFTSEPVQQWVFDGPLTYQLVGLDAIYEELAVSAMEAWTATTGVQFVAQSGFGTADITFRDNEPGAFSSSEYLDSGAGPAELTNVYINIEQNWNPGDTENGAQLDTYTYQTFIHEIGHALGLGHAGPYNFDGTFDFDSAFSNDSWQMSVMSYFSQAENPNVGDTEAFVLTPMPADLAAIRLLYPNLADVNTGDDLYFTGASGGYLQTITAEIAAGAFTHPVALTLVDDAGHDRLDFSSSTDAIWLDLTPGGISDIYGATGNLQISANTWIEEAHGGAGDDHIQGNDLGNTLSGGGGSNVVIGGAGTDRVVLTGAFDDAEILSLDDGVRISFGDTRDTISEVEEFAFTDGVRSLAEVLAAGGTPAVLLDEDSVLEDFRPAGLPPAVTLTGASASEGDAIISNGLLTYTPPPDFAGDVEITLTYLDENRVEQTTTLSVVVDPVNDAPVAGDDSFEAVEDTPITLTGVLDNDSDVDGDALTLHSVTVPEAQGSAEIEGTDILFTPARDFFGEAEISYVVADAQGAESTGQISVTVTGTPDLPSAVDDTASMAHGSSLLVDVLANDTDPDGGTLSLASATAERGEVSIEDGQLAYTAPADGSSDVVTYVVANDTGEAEGELLLTLQAAEESDEGDDDAFGGLGLLLLLGLGALAALGASGGLMLAGG